MSSSSLLESSRRPAAVALRLLLWPVVILQLSDLAARTEDDGLAGGLMVFAAIAATALTLAFADGLVLRARPLVLVWSITTVVVAGRFVAQPMVDFLVHGPEGSTWADTVRFTFEDLPFTSVFFLFLVGLPVAVGAAGGAVLRWSAHAVAGPVPRPTGFTAPRG